MKNTHSKTILNTYAKDKYTLIISFNKKKVIENKWKTKKPRSYVICKQIFLS